MYIQCIVLYSVHIIFTLYIAFLYGVYFLMYMVAIIYLMVAYIIFRYLFSGAGVIGGAWDLQLTMWTWRGCHRGRVLIQITKPLCNVSKT